MIENGRREFEPLHPLYKNTIMKEEINSVYF